MHNLTLQIQLKETINKLHVNNYSINRPLECFDEECFQQFDNQRACVNYLIEMTAFESGGSGTFDYEPVTATTLEEGAIDGLKAVKLG